MCVVKETHTVPSRLLLISQWPHGNSCTWAHVLYIHIYKHIIYYIYHILYIW